MRPTECESPVGPSSSAKPTGTWSWKVNDFGSGPSSARSLYTSVILGEQAASKTAQRGSTPRARADGGICRRGSTEKGTGLVNRLMLARIQSSALGCPDGVVDGTRASEARSPGSTPGRDTGSDENALRVCRMSTAVLETARRGSIPRRGAGDNDICPRSVPDSHATLRRSKARFNSWRGHLIDSTLEPDGTATACKAVQSGFDSHRRR